MVEYIMQKMLWVARDTGLSSANCKMKQCGL